MTSLGLFSFIKGQFIEVIEWNDTTGSVVYKFPVYDNAIKMGAQLIVRESQAAIFVNEGVIADIFGPGRHTLSTQNMPILTGLKSWKYGFNSPFKADVYFVSTAIFTDQKWGTTNPVIMRDPEFGMIRLRGFGNYSFRVNDPALFMRGIFGTNESFSADSLNSFFKTLIVSNISDILAESKIPVADLAASYQELSHQAGMHLNQSFADIGLLLVGFVIENLSLPEEVEKMIDRKSSMNIAGNLDQYMKYQAAEAIREAANNPDNGIAGAGAGMGAAMAMGQMFTGVMNNSNSNPPAPQAAPSPVTPPVAGTVACKHCGHQNQAGAKFCSDCGTPSAVVNYCSQCGSEQAPNSKFCSVCGTKQ